ncbi:hypothetical protein HNP55_001671 [Paucibacter oligotrophus]|uniref:Zn-dependent protease DUF2268 n=1 Tax=Roseateles oligotrophus TaxID=1769250 RepID=A0A840L909_9BURK|nr:hypothetical protein [Roseateles oligotrophus]MBB4843152.1 hypothetical protein [Roseateles oligotrophus]
MRRLLASVLLSFCVTGQARAVADPLTVEIQAKDAQRFAAVFLAAEGRPSAEQLQRGYLDQAGPGVAVFMPGRIQDAQNLARVVARRGQHYRYAIEHCLPQLPSLTGDLRAIYLAFAGLQPERPLPEIQVIFGAGNSGGTASAETHVQALALEVLCPVGTTPEQFRTTLRGFFAHETVHTWQKDATPAQRRDPMLWAALNEGLCDYLASLVTGQVPMPERGAWARAREAVLWQEFLRDAQTVKAGTDAQGEMNPAASKTWHRWFANAGSAPPDWPSEAGYWVGMRIAQSYVARAADKPAAIRRLIDLDDDLAALLKASAYAP